MTARARICLGAFAGAHGVRGEARLKTFTDSERNVAAYGPVVTEDGARRFTLKIVRIAKPGLVIVKAPEIKSREDAAALAGVRLYVDRDALPAADEDEFYYEDLVGLHAVDENGGLLGAVSAVYNFGAGDLLELKGVPGRKGAVMIAFTRETAPEIDIEGGRIVIAAAALADSDSEAPPEGGEEFFADAIRQEDA